MLALQHIPNLGDPLAKKLVNRFSSAQAVFKASNKSLHAIPWLPKGYIKDLKNKQFLLNAAAQEIQAMRANYIKAAAFNEDTYPYRLKQCVDGPLLLFYQGNLDLKNPRCISIVGTRRMTTYGQEVCRQLVRELAPYNPIIVSGLAFGVDITAHQAAMDYGLQTVACLAHGLHTVMPKTHRHYKTSIQKHGGFLSDFWTSSPFHNKHYLRRNRIIAGLSEATIVIESAQKGGSLVTADIAFSYDREVFAIPGRTQDIYSQGCNALIQQNKAQLLNSSKDLIATLGWNNNTQLSSQARQQRLFEALNELEAQTLEYLPEYDPIHLDLLAKISGLPAPVLAGSLLTLELKGLVKPVPGNLFKRH